MAPLRPSSSSLTGALAGGTAPKPVWQMRKEKSKGLSRDMEPASGSASRLCPKFTGPQNPCVTPRLALSALSGGSLMLVSLRGKTWLLGGALTAPPAPTFLLSSRPGTPPPTRFLHLPTLVVPETSVPLASGSTCSLGHFSALSPSLDALPRWLSSSASSPMKTVWIKRAGLSGFIVCTAACDISSSGRPSCLLPGEGEAAHPPGGAFISKILCEGS